MLAPMPTPTRASVVVSTYNRAAGLRATLEGLRHQTHDAFEVIVVNGPSTDDTAAVLAEYSGRVRVGICTAPSLTVSRNVGIALAAGEIVAFIDDDAIPEPAWLADLVAAYDDPGVGGAGGIVYDHTGMALQYRYAVCTRTGEPRFDAVPPLDRYLRPGCDPFLYLQGTNQSYRRSALVAVGGFNEALLHYHDDCEIAMRMIDTGHPLRALSRAIVHHKYMASAVRNHARVLVDPYRIVRDRLVFARLARPTAAVDLADMAHWTAGLRDAGRAERDAGRLTDAEFDHYSQRIDEAITDVVAEAPSLTRPHRLLPAPDPDAFVPYPTLRPEGRRLTVCYLTKDYPPGEFGGVGRLTADFADELAARGHEVHVVTGTQEAERVDFERGVWVHRIDLGGLTPVELADLPCAPNLLLMRGMYREVCRIHERGALDVVVGALWLAAGTFCALDPRFPTVLLLESGTRTIADFHPSWEDSPAIQQLIALEGAHYRRAAHLHAISHDILATVRAQYGPTDAHSFVVPLGRRDPQGSVTRRRGADGRVRILFVSRLERRKGVDVLLPVAARLARDHSHVEVVVAGQETPHTEIGESYPTAFHREWGGVPGVAARVTFPGWLSEQDLAQAYVDADIFCLPARYESFGLVVVEAMAFGLPVVTSRVGGLTEIVEEERSGLLVPVEDGSALERALTRLIEDGGLRERLAAGARARFAEHFDLAHTIPTTIAALTRVVEQHRASDAPAIGATAATQAVESGITSVIREAVGLPAERAATIARTLLDPAWHSHQRLRAIVAAWSADDEGFLRVVYQAVLERPPDPAGLRHWLQILATGRARTDIVRALATSHEAMNRDPDTTWLSMLPQTARASPLRRALGRVRRFARKLPSYAANAAYLPTNVRELRRELAAARQAQERVQRALGDQAARTDRLAERQREHHTELEALLAQEVPQRFDTQFIAVQNHLRALSDWIALLQRKVEMLTLDLREQVMTPRPNGLPAPRPVDALVFERKLAAMDGQLRVNLGCGEIPFDGYVNVDFRAAPHVDLVADARRLPFADGSLKEIASSHLVEHFRRHEFITIVLPYWHRLLQADGILRIVCPNWEEMLRRLHDGRMTLPDFTTVTFGAQDHSGDDHHSMYTPQTLREILANGGFDEITLVSEVRQNGLCPEMELVARKRSGPVSRPSSP